MNRLIHASALALATTSIPGAVAADPMSIEIMHFWTSPGETEALNVFADAFRESGGDWVQIGSRGMTTMKRRAIKRMVLGFPPTAIQWHAGPELGEILKLGLARPVDDVTEASDLKNKLHPAVVDALSHDNKLGALPVGIHGDNWAWYNSAIYRELNLPFPESWTEFLEQAPKIVRAGYEPLAIGGWNWELVLLFNSVVVDVAGKDTYVKMTAREPLTKAEYERIANALVVFRTIRDYASSKPDSPQSWSAATKRVIEGQSALQIMGDWAKGAFLAAGKTPGKDFECRLAPGNDDAFMLVVDVFILTESDDVNARTAQVAFVDTILDPENQLQFAQKKGSLPVIREFDLDNIDKCMSLGLQKFFQKDATVPSLSLIHSTDQSAAYEAFVVDLWESDDMADADARAIALTGLF